MVSRRLSKEENDIWLANLPKKSVAVKAIIKSSSGNVLLVKPYFKDGLQFPGGGVEPAEDPKDALIRELKEELDLTLDKDKFKLVDSVFRKQYENLMLIYEYLLPIDEDHPIEYGDDEIENYRYENPSNVASLISDYYYDFWQNYIS